MTADARPRLLFLSAYLPSPVSSQAGQKIAYRHLRWLAEQYDVWFAGFCNEADRPEHVVYLRDMCREVCLIRVDSTTRLWGVLSRPWLPLLVSVRWHPRLARVVRTWAATHGFSRVHCEWTQMAEYLSLVPGISERWISGHDVVFQFCERMAQDVSGIRRPFWRWETRRARRWEESRGRLATHILLLSTKDAELIRRELPVLASKLKVVPPYFERYRARLRTTDPTGPVLLFWGAMSREENAKAALWLARELMPQLWRLLPQTCLIIAGSNPPEAVRSCAEVRIRVTGFVEDPQAVFDEAHMAVLPLFRGAGIKVKVLECLAAGLPVLTSDIGAEGIAATEADGLAVLRPDSVHYAARVQDWWQAPGRLERLSQGALNWADRQVNADARVLCG